MNFSKTAAKAAVVAALGAGALGLGSGLAHADHHDWPYPPPGPGVNVGGPGNPLPPGQGGWPPPGHRDRDWRGDDWRGDDWHGYPPPSPPWAYGAPVFWNNDFNGWGVVVNGVFIGV